MKRKHTLFILFICMALSALGQFHGITTTPKGIVRIDRADTPVNSHIDDEIMPSSANDGVQSLLDERKKWIDQYLSVSLPLKEIKVTSPYGYRKDPFTGKRAKHNGIDLTANYEDVYAMMFGQVEKVGSDKRSGNYVKIKHADYTVIYCHLSKINVKKGQFVIAGQPVGVTGNTGRSTGPHLHYEVRYRGKHINPIIFIDYVNGVRQEAISKLVDFDNYTFLIVLKNQNSSLTAPTC